MKKILFLLFFGQILNFYGQNIENNTILIEKNQNFEKVFSELKKKIKEKDLKIFTIIHHDREAQKSNLPLGKTKVLIFGNPKVGTLLMQENPEIALALPLKILIFEQNGKIWLRYDKISALKEPYAIEKKGKILEKIDETIENLLKSL